MGGTLDGDGLVVHELKRTEEPQARASRAPMTWMQWLRRVYDIDVSVGPECGAGLGAGGVNRPTVIT